MEIAEFVAPAWSENQSADEIHEEMLATLPDDIDKGEGGFPWDFTMPTALVKSELVEYTLIEVLKNIFPQWAYGQILDYHAECRGLKRKEAISSSVIVTVEGVDGTIIAEGFSFSTESTSDIESLQFEADGEYQIGESGSVDVLCYAVEEGSVGNVPANSIVFMTTTTAGITNVNNSSAAHGGDDEEDDESLRQRIVEYDQNQGVSFVGSVSDYKRWAESYESPTLNERVGRAMIVEPTYTSGVDDSDKIQIVLTNSLGLPASTELCQEIYNYIMKPDDPESRFAPINANIKVIPMDEMDIYVQGELTLESGFVLSAVKQEIVNALINYLNDCTSIIKISQICRVILAIDGVDDYADVKLSVDGVAYTHANVTVTNGCIPTTSWNKVVLTDAAI